MKFGIDRLIEDASVRKPLEGKRVALLAHPASVTKDLTHSMDAIAACNGIDLTAAFGPQHGLRGDKQDNMVESDDYTDPVHGIPVFSLYGESRRPSVQAMDTFDVLLVDLQDLGCRIYTFITTLRYMMEAAAEHGKSVWVLDRPNPIGRPIEGLMLEEGWESFVGAAPMPMRHGLTMGEMGRWFISYFDLDLDYHIIAMQGWQPEGTGFGWPEDRVWINPSPNAPNLAMARSYPGTVMLEGTNLSEGRGTTRPLELFGAPDIDAKTVIAEMRRKAPQWLEGVTLRECWFEPTFHKHQGMLCNGVQIHAEGPNYDHSKFRPWRLQALALKAIKKIHSGYEIWRDFHYEYEEDRLAFDLINGGPRLREWIDNHSSIANDLEAIAAPDERIWGEALREYLIY
jgi:uncharacterized protein YbbC (DUF1343 family)